MCGFKVCKSSYIQYKEGSQTLRGQVYKQVLTPLEYYLVMKILFFLFLVDLQTELCFYFSRYSFLCYTIFVFLFSFYFFLFCFRDFIFQFIIIIIFMNVFSVSRYSGNVIFNRVLIVKFSGYLIVSMVVRMRIGGRHFRWS